MKIKLNHSIRGLYLAIAGLVGFVSCSDDFPSNIESDKYTDLKEIRIVNAGRSGTEIIEGEIDELAKLITFPTKLDTLSDLMNLTLEYVVSEGASLEKNVYAVPYTTGDTQKEIYLKVVNSPRFKEYKAVIEYDVPLFGADIKSARYYDYSANPLGNPPYINLGAARGFGFDGESVLVIDRSLQTKAHLLSVANLKSNIIDTVGLNMDGVEGGTFDVNMGAQAYGHTYVANLSGDVGSPYKIYHWANPKDKPDVVINLDRSLLPDLPARIGDAFSLSIDSKGNGYAYVLGATSSFLRVKISDFKIGSEPTVLTSRINYEQWSHFNRIDNSESYVMSSHSQRISLASESGSIEYTMEEGALPKSLSDIKIFEFNNQRYLLGITVPRNIAFTTGATLYLYNITEGDNITDALIALGQKAADGKPAPAIFEYEILAGANGSPGTQAGYHIVKDADGKDSKLTIFGATFSGGFAMIEFDAYGLAD